MSQAESIRSLVDVINKILDLPKQGVDQRARGWSFGYIGNTYGLEHTPAYVDERRWTVWAPHPDRIGRERETLGYVRTQDLDELRIRVSGVIHYLRATKPSR